MVNKPLHLPRQTTIYTCGAACLAAVSRLQGGTLDEMALAREMHAKPVTGIENETLWNTAKNMGAENCGENIWDFRKCAVLNILNPISGVGHYVVALRTNENGDVIAYCPYYANTLRLARKWLEDHWVSGNGLYRKWAIVFPFTVAQEAFFVGEKWPEMGLEAGEANPHWLLRSVHGFIESIVAEKIKP
jgi:ABC-type bacteriocin/lantibiotic exporter with double-glycine peptidase domain